MRNKITFSGLFSVYILGFIFAFHTALPTYINSSFINTFISERLVGVIYVISYIFTIICFIVMPVILRKFGNYKTALFLVIGNFISLVGLSFLDSYLSAIIFFILNLITVSLVYFSLDMFLEGFSADKETGKIRGIYLTSVNLAWAISPLISGLILTSFDYSKIYLASFILLIPVLLILVLNLRNYKDSKYEVTDVWQTIKMIFKNKNISNIFFANFLLYFFYSIMVIYTPIYLYKYIGFSWGEIGIIFSIMLLPFVLVQFPLGVLADKKWGEKEFLTLGFIIAALSTGVISLINDKNIALWAIILFLTRVGASIIEVMCDTYFFKKVDSLDVNIISTYRMLGPISYVLGPLFVTVVFTFFAFDIKYIFLALGLIMFLGLKASLSIKDTK